jgi:Asp-tRNA(Asn)/Glu-tRNA(Gln) amidotransferase A subunit family amidase
MNESTPGDELSYMTAAEALPLFRKKELSPVDLLLAVIRRSEAVNARLNALTATYYERALEQARKAEAAYSRSDGFARPLEGVPVAIKDFHPIAGEITTCGSVTLKDNRPDTTAPTVQRLLDAGAIMHCRTTTPEFAFGITTHSKLFGVTRNPWNLDYSPCGSSGGAGAAVAAGMTTLADGTDSGGSIRAPASACGVFGFLPPYGRNPSDRRFRYESLLRYGPITRSVADAALMQNVMCGPHPEDPATVPDGYRLPAELEPVKGCKIALSMNLGFYEIDREVESAVRDGARALSEVGCDVSEIELGWTNEVADAINVYVEYLVHASSAHLLPEWEEELTPHIKALIARGAKLKASTVAYFTSVRIAMYQSIQPVLQQYDLLICPTLAAPGVLAEHNNMDPNFTINGKPVGAYLEWGLTYPFNMLGYLPVASVPCGFTREGIPIGMQIVARPFDDLSVFRAAATFERIRPWRHRHPPI